MTKSASEPIAVGVELTDRRAFASALAWPGWSRAGRDEASALAALASSRDRYAAVVAAAGGALPGRTIIDVVERRPGTATTAFGAPDVVFERDRLPADEREAAQLSSLVEAAWRVLDAVAATAPLGLRKGPRGGGRDRDAVIAHVVAADAAYARQIGLQVGEPAAAGRAAVEALRQAMLEALGRTSDGSPLGGRRWPPRYAARRIAWHALDHAWEIEDRSAPD